MLLVIYNSNPQNKPDLPTDRGWSFYDQEDWSSICVAVDSYFFHMPFDDTEITNGIIRYNSYEKWLADYQVSEIEEYNLDSDCIYVLSYFLGDHFFVPDVILNSDDEPTYPEMDAYA